MAYAQVLLALADPTRRGLYERLVGRPHRVGELARLARLSQPAVSQHLRVLSEASLATHEREGTRRHYRASRAGLDELRSYLESMWDDVLAAYAAGDPVRQDQSAPTRATAARVETTRGKAVRGKATRVDKTRAARTTRISRTRR